MVTDFHHLEFNLVDLPSALQTCSEFEESLNLCDWTPLCQDGNLYRFSEYYVQPTYYLYDKIRVHNSKAYWKIYRSDKPYTTVTTVAR